MTRLKSIQLSSLICCILCLSTFTIQSELAVGLNKGLVIDAGLSGSILHVYSWKAKSQSKGKTSYLFPEANEVWTDKVEPGISTLDTNPNSISDHLAPLIRFAKSSLQGLDSSFGGYPIYFKATGLDLSKQEILLQHVQNYLSNKTLCPFYFKKHFAELISGEQEAVYAWTAANFLQNSIMLDSRSSSETLGVLNLGASSAYIAHSVSLPSPIEGGGGGGYTLHTLQLGSESSLMLYTKYLAQNGLVLSRMRYLASVVDKYVSVNDVLGGSLRRPHSITDNCFFAGYSESVTDTAGMFKIDVAGPVVPHQEQLNRCLHSLKGFFSEERKSSILERGLPNNKVSGKQPTTFLALSGYKYAWRFLRLPQTATLDEFRAKAHQVCSMTFADVLFYFETHNLVSDPNGLNAYLPHYCFVVSYILVLLQDEFHMQMSQTLKVMSDEVQGYNTADASWTLGAILHEINTLPKHAQDRSVGKYSWSALMLATTLGFAVGSMSAVFIYRKLVEGGGNTSKAMFGSGRRGGGDSPVHATENNSFQKIMPALELLEANVEFNSTVGSKHRMGSAAGGSSGSNASVCFSGAGSPSAVSLRKAALLSPYSSPTKKVTATHRRNSASSSFGSSVLGIAHEEFGDDDATTVPVGVNSFLKQIPIDFRSFASQSGTEQYLDNDVP